MYCCSTASQYAMQADHSVIQNPDTVILRDLLAACWSLERFNHYVFGKQVVIETDHKPLESIWKKSIPSASPRLQRLLLKMAKCNVEMRYIQGKTNVIADALSRVCYMEPPEEDQGVPVLNVNAITSTLPASPAKLDEVRNHTRPKRVLELQRRPEGRKWPYPKGASPLIPSTQMLQIIHQGHLGAEKCQLKARDCIFWPGISKDIIIIITCTQFSKLQPKKLLHWSTVPVDNRLLQQVPHRKKAELNHICCCYQPPQVGICRAWNTRNPGIRQRAPVYQSQICSFFANSGVLTT